MTTPTTEKTSSKSLATAAPTPFARRFQTYGKNDQDGNDSQGPAKGKLILITDFLGGGTVGFFSSNILRFASKDRTLPLRPLVFALSFIGTTVLTSLTCVLH